MKNCYHLNCVKIISPLAQNVIGHCILLQDDTGALALIDTGIGLLDTKDPYNRIGKEMIEIAGFQFNEEITAFRQIEELGLNPLDVTDCILSHLDPDHTSGITDFPWAAVHVSSEEYANFKSGNLRYLKHHFEHNPFLVEYNKSDEKWFSFEARRIKATVNIELFLIPLFGHTKGHCGIAYKFSSKWYFYVADAYYLQAELVQGNTHPVNELATINADNNNLRLSTLQKIRELKMAHPEITIFCYHDWAEFSQF